MKTYMLILPRNKVHHKELKMMKEELDAKKWIIARETGRGGYEHWQCRVSVSGDLREWNERNGLGWHIEDANDVWEYEQKDGDYWCSWDTVETILFRKGRLRDTQSRLIRSVDSQGDRGVTIWIDKNGGFGKTWAFLRGVLEGWVLPVPAVAISTSKLGGWVKSAYRGQRILWIDIPRAKKIETDLWACIEELKGIAYEWRYASSWILTIGLKILVTTNNELSKNDLAQLSADRWDIHYIEEIKNKEE